MSRSVSLAVAGAAGLFLSFAANLVYGAVRDYDVRLIPQVGTGVLKAHLIYGRNCDDQLHVGCMSFDTNTVGAITFALTGNSQNDITCPNTPTPGNHRVITMIEVTQNPNAEYPAEKGDFSGGVEADSWLKKYAFPQADADGYIYKVEDKMNGLTRVTVINMNSHPATQGTKPFWYKITVADCNSNTTWVTDPRGDNKGLD